MRDWVERVEMLRLQEPMTALEILHSLSSMGNPAHTELSLVYVGLHAIAQLLQAAVDYADDDDSLREIFHAPAIRAIVQHKWDGNTGDPQMQCKVLFAWRFVAYLLHVGLFTLVVLFFSASDSDVTGFGVYRTDPAIVSLAWVCWWVVLVYTIVLGWGELRQVRPGVSLRELNSHVS